MVTRVNSNAVNVGFDVNIICSRWFAVYTKQHQERTALLNLIALANISLANGD